jgi:hypothetical protein
LLLAGQLGELGHFLALVHVTGRFGQVALSLRQLTGALGHLLCLLGPGSVEGVPQRLALLADPLQVVRQLVLLPLQLLSLRLGHRVLDRVSRGQFLGTLGKLLLPFRRQLQLHLVEAFLGQAFARLQHLLHALQGRGQLLIGFPQALIACFLRRLLGPVERFGAAVHLLVGDLAGALGDRLEGRRLRGVAGQVAQGSLDVAVLLLDALQILDLIRSQDLLGSSFLAELVQTTLLPE